MKKNFLCKILLCIMLLGMPYIHSNEAINIPKGWSSELWKTCWNAEGGWLDFTPEVWMNLSTKEQIKLSTTYREWYAENHAKQAKEKTFVIGKTDFVMLLIPPGKFWMGSPLHENGRHEDEKLHRVLISKAFWLGKMEINQSQWQKIMGYNPAKFSNMGLNAPVEQVSWQDCQKFCEKINALESSGANTSNLWDFPTEAQWEYACRGGVSSACYFGEGSLYPYAWFSETSNSMTHPGGQKEPNAWGLYDVYGNVWEWCKDSCDDKNGSIVTNTYDSDSSDPCSISGGNKIMRGGSWRYRGSSCRSAIRYSMLPHLRYYFMGLRIMRKVE